MQKNHWYNDWGLKVEGRSEVNSKDVCNSLRKEISKGIILVQYQLFTRVLFPIYIPNSLT